MMVMMLGGATPDRLLVSNASLSDAATAPDGAAVFYELRASGQLSTSSGILAPWIDPVYRAGDYEARASLLAGSVPAGTLNVWLPLSANRSWSLSRTLPGGDNCTLQIEFRPAGGALARTITVTMQIDVEA